MSTQSKYLIVGLIILSFAYGVYTFIGKGTDSELASVEIRDYQGERLGSINDFRENSIRGPQSVDEETFRLKITGLVSGPYDLTIKQVESSFKPYEKVVTVNCVEGWSVKLLWEGVKIEDLLANAGVKSEGKVLIFHAVDGYTSALPLDYVMTNDILLAYKMNGVNLPPQRGYPFQVVAESKWGYKWVKWVNEIEVSDNVNYRGYWESRGYSNYGGIDRSFGEN
ncbi:MAG: molybdopterin-dependent oxidoreductase [Candidatus Bathyarchaeota archaeon]|nr:molybdopterin-dependent oxidoreductase [Candidatus Bathyarchaeota archaeon]